MNGCWLCGAKQRPQSKSQGMNLKSKSRVLLEREMAIVKERTGRHDEELTNIPELIKVEFRLANRRTARLSQDVSDFKTDMDIFRNQVVQRFDKLEKKIDGFIETFPTNAAGFMREVLNDKDKWR
jgi:hypothetical protein